MRLSIGITGIRMVMTSQPIVPCLWFDDQAEQAAAFYAQTFPESSITAVSHYPQSADNPAGKPRGSVLTVELSISGQRFTALNGGPMFAINPSISFFAHVDTSAQAERLFAALAKDGTVRMPLDAYPWSERYAWVQDRFGVSWQVITGRRQPTEAAITPCLMFAGPACGRAEEAMQRLAGIFPDGRIDSVERYAANEGPEGMVKHGRFGLAGQTMVAMDSGVEHAFTFNEAVSLQVMCEHQSDVDRYWAALSQGGEEGVCGWLKDRFGISWQMVPVGVSKWLSSNDVAARDRAFAAMMRMTKPDVAALEAAFRGP